MNDAFVVVALKKMGLPKCLIKYMFDAGFIMRPFPAKYMKAVCRELHFFCKFYSDISDPISGWQYRDYNNFMYKLDAGEKKYKKWRLSFVQYDKYPQPAVMYKFEGDGSSIDYTRLLVVIYLCRTIQNEPLYEADMWAERERRRVERAGEFIALLEY